MFASPGASAPVTKHTPPVTRITTQAQINARTRAQANDSTGPAVKAKGNGSSSSSTPGQSTALQALLKQAGGIGSMVDVKSLANAVAQAQYGPVISNLLQQQIENPLQEKQNEGDINEWYGQVKSSKDTAATNLKTENTAAQTSLASVLKGITGGLGGAANQGNGMVDSVGANAIGTESALGNIQQGYLSSLAPILELAQGGAISAQKAQSSKTATDLAAQLAQAQAGMNSQQLISQGDYQKQNDSVQQQRFQNQFGILQAIAAQQLANNNANNKTVMDAATLKKMAAQIQAENARTKVLQNAPAKNSFEAASPTTLQSIALTLANAAKGAGGAKNIQGAWNAISQGLAASGWNANDPKVRQWVSAAVLPGAGLNAGMIYGNGG